MPAFGPDQQLLLLFSGQALKPVFQFQRDRLAGDRLLPDQHGGATCPDIARGAPPYFIVFMAAADGIKRNASVQAVIPAAQQIKVPLSGECSISHVMGYNRNVNVSKC